MPADCAEEEECSYDQLLNGQWKELSPAEEWADGLYKWKAYTI